ncbi:DUF2029 domain-containing protein [Geomonas terrae]|uniref:DUF2029 domain-containing protein n=1 Tax=Geomonas terrae TaxID=2562681 RepID=A0A4S1CMG6_9BACT|nr:glycosyltransferase family 87 protein [Geomonas terrae]TGU74470.1 DUF2029 domain-containing protein [Geomonas terrae]
MAESGHVIKRIVVSMPSFAKPVLATLIAVCGTLSLWRLVQYFTPEYIYQRDFIQEYLLAKAVLTGTDPYAPLPELAKRFLGPLTTAVFQHPTPHPPAVGLLFSPLGLLSYQHAVQTWFVIQLALVAASAYGMLRCLELRPTPFVVLTCSFLAVTWSPFFQDLVLGQLMTLKLALLIGTWYMLKTGREAGGGLFLGAAIAVKFIAWPLVLLLAVLRRWKAVVAAGLTVLAANGVAAMVIGSDAVIAYYTKVGPLVSSLYRGHASNFSVWSIAGRLFAGTDSPAMCGVKAAPLWSAPELAGPLAFVAPVVLLGAGLFASARVSKSSFDAPFALMVCVSILISPVAWNCYLVLAAIPAALVAKRLVEQQFPVVPTNAAIMAGALLMVPPTTLNRLMSGMGDPASAGACRPLVPFPVTTISLVPLVAVLVLMWLVWTLEVFSAGSRVEDGRGTKGLPG